MESVQLMVPNVIEVSTKGIDWISIISLMATFLTIILGLSQFKKQLNRNIYERRLTETYAPLMGWIAKQELLRKKDESKLNYDVCPVINVEYSNKDTGEIYTLIDRKHLIELGGKINLGLASPKLLKLIKEYELIVELEDKCTNIEEIFNWATNRKVPIEKKLVFEIIKGYKETAKQLNIDDAMELDVFNYPHIKE